MAREFKIELSMSEAPAEAQARITDALAEPAAAVGLRLSSRRPGELKYRPLVRWPFLLVLWRNLSGEKMTVKFEPADDGGTWVKITGAVARARQPLAADPEHWGDAVGTAAHADGPGPVPAN
jgi:hypothetical protein